MRYILVSVLSFVIICSGAVSADAQSPEAQRAAILKDNMDMAQRLEDVVSPVLVGSADLCGSYRAQYLGAEFMTQAGVGKSYKDLVAQHYGVGEHPTITIIGKGSPAAGKLKAEDVITAVNGQSLKKGNDGQYALEDEIAKGGALKLTLNRDGAQKNITITPASVCGAKVRLDASDEDKIWAESGKVFVSKGALRKRSSADLASEIKSQLSRYKR